MYDQNTYKIYLIFNSVNGKLYVGQTIRGIEKRWKNHLFVARGGKDKYPSQFSALHAAVKKYGETHFIIKEVDTTTNRQELDVKEIMWIDCLLNNGFILYNLTNGGGGIKNYHHSNDTKLKISKSHLGKFNSFYGKKHTKKTLDLLKKCHAGQKHSENTKKKMSDNHPNKIITEKIAIDIINRLKLKQKMSDISRELQISYSVINGIKRNKNWKHLPR
jgi:group I intron endonuclease